MKKHGKFRFDYSERVPGTDVDINYRAARAYPRPEAQIRDLSDTRNLSNIAKRLAAARRDYRRFCIIVIITAAALVSAAWLTGYIISILRGGPS
jgi:hypothetical protein